MALSIMSKINFKGAPQQTVPIPSQISVEQSQQGSGLSSQPSKDEFILSSSSQQSTPKKPNTESESAEKTSQAEGGAKDAASQSPAEAPKPAQK